MECLHSTYFCAVDFVCTYLSYYVSLAVSKLLHPRFCQTVFLFLPFWQNYGSLALIL